MTPLLIIMVLAHAADLATTHLGLARGCVELNPVYGLVGYSFPAMVAIKATCVGTIGAMAVAADHRLSRVILWTAIVAGAGAAAWNLYVMQAC